MAGVSFDLGGSLNGLITNLGVFAPCAFLGYKVIIWYRDDLRGAHQRINDLTDSVMKLTADIAAAVRGGKGEP